MISLITRCREIGALFTPLTLIGASLLLGIQDNPEATAQQTQTKSANSLTEKSILELYGPWIDKQVPVATQEQDAAPTPRLKPVVSDLPSPQDESLPPIQGPLEEIKPEIMMRGPLHEAFADAHQADPKPNPVINRQPPELIKELPPEFKPEGKNVEWVPGYWAFDEDQDDFIWISGLWRDIPPNQRWVPGYWEEAENGFRWIPGFWTGEEEQQLNYLPTPPQSLDLGPSTAAPSDDYFYCPGNWEYRGQNYVWRTGHWQPRVENWIWIPARYIWTPRGCVFRPGYWDHEFDNRGTLFAPVYFQRPPQVFANYSYTPNYCMNTGADFLVHLFVRPNCNSYFFGNWYGNSYANRGYRSWVSPASHFRAYDPLLSHYNCNRYRYGQTNLVGWINQQHRHYAANQSYRPRLTYSAQINLARGKHDHRHDDYYRRATYARHYQDEIGRKAERINRSKSLSGKRNDKKYVRIDNRDRHDHQQDAIDRIRNSRKKNERPADRHVQSKDRLNPNRPTAKPRDPVVLNKKNQREQDRQRQIAQDDARKTQRDREKEARKRELDQKVQLARQNTERLRQEREQKKRESEQARALKRTEAQQKIDSRRAADPNYQARMKKKQELDQRLKSEKAQREQQTAARRAADPNYQARMKKKQELDQRLKSEKAQREQQTAARRAADPNYQARMKKKQELDQRLQLEKTRRDQEAAARRASDKSKLDAIQLQQKQKRDARNREREAQNKRLQDAAKRTAEQRDLQRRQQNQASPGRTTQSNSDKLRRQAELKAKLDNDRAKREAMDRQRKMQRDLDTKARNDRTRQIQEAARRASQQKEQQRLREKAARAQADQQRRAAAQAKVANDNARREAQQRARQEKQRADQARRAREVQQRRQADQQRQAQQRRNREAQRAKRKKK